MWQSVWGLSCEMREARNLLSCHALRYHLQVHLFQYCRIRTEVMLPHTGVLGKFLHFGLKTWHGHTVGLHKPWAACRCILQMN